MAGMALVRPESNSDRAPSAPIAQSSDRWHGVAVAQDSGPRRGAAGGFLHACDGGFAQNLEDADGDGIGEEDMDKYLVAGLYASEVKQKPGDGPGDNPVVHDLVGALETAAAQYAPSGNYTPPHDGTEDCGCTSP